MMKLALRSLGLLLVLASVGCTTRQPGGIYYAPGGGAVSPDGLHALEWEPFKATFVRPGADLSQYDKVLIKEVTIAYKTPPKSNFVEETAIEPNYALPPESLASMKKHFHQALATSLGKSKNFTVVDAAGPDVLLIAAHIVNLRISQPPKAALNADETTLTDSSGQMTLILEANDSVSGESLVRVGQAQVIQKIDGGWYQSDPVSNSSNVRQIFQNWADTLRQELDQFHSLPRLPPVAASAP